MSVSGVPPRCETCQSLERHRSIREFFNALKSRRLKSFDVLQFSKDPAVDPRWFGHFEVSMYGGANSLDLQNIDRPDGRYDLVICNHVLEHVEDDGAALRELVRVLKPGGCLFLTVPDPIRRSVTTDWGYPDEAQHGHFRTYGADIVERFVRHAPRVGIERANLKDSVTGTPDHAFIFYQPGPAGCMDLIRSNIADLTTVQTPIAA